MSCPFFQTNGTVGTTHSQLFYPFTLFGVLKSSFKSELVTLAWFSSHMDGNVTWYKDSWFPFPLHCFLKPSVYRSACPLWSARHCHKGRHRKTKLFILPSPRTKMCSGSHMVTWASTSQEDRRRKERGKTRSSLKLLLLLFGNYYFLNLSESERELERCICHLLVHSLNAWKSQARAMAKLGAGVSHQVSHKSGKNISTWAMLPAMVCMNRNVRIWSGPGPSTQTPWCGMLVSQMTF